MSLRLVSNWLTYLMVRLFICLVQAMRIETCHALARVLAFLACDVVRLRHKVIDENLSHAFPDHSPDRRRKLARGMWEHLLLMVCEIAHVPRKIHETNWRDYIQLNDIAPQVRCLLDRRPAVVLAGHFGNFEVGGYFLGLFGYPTFTIVRPLDNPFLQRFVNGFRQANGQQVLPKRNIAQQVADRLAEGQNLVILGDQYGGPKGCRINFFGRPASYNKAIALFSLTSGAPICIGYTRRLNRPLQFEMGVVGLFDPADESPNIRGASDLLQWYNDHLEQIVRMAPEQYWWLHRRWKERPVGKRRFIKARKSGVRSQGLEVRG